MPLLPRAARPSVIIRRKAIYSGVLGQSTMWKLVAGVMIGRGAIKKIFGKTTEVIDVSKMGPERFMTLTTAKPITRRRARRMRKQGVAVPTLKDQKAYGKLWAAQADAAKRAS